MIKQYTAEYNNFQCVIAIDHEKCTDELLHSINDFWSDSEWRLSDADGNIAKAVTTLLAKTCFQLQYEKYGLNNWGIMKEFDWDDRGGVEGWPKMDGSKGILLVSCENPEIEIDFLEVKTLTEMPKPPKKPEW